MLQAEFQDEQGWLLPEALCSSGDQLGQGEALQEGSRATYPSLIDGIVELSLHGDLAVGVGVHEGQAEAGVLSAPAGQTTKLELQPCLAALGLYEGHGVRRHSPEWVGSC